MVLAIHNHMSSEIRSPEGAWHCLSIRRWADCNIIVNINIYQKKVPIQTKHPNMFLNDFSFLFPSPSHLSPFLLALSASHFHLLSLVFSEDGLCVGLCSATQPSPYQLWGSRLHQDQGPISKSRQGSGKEVIRLWGGGRQKLYFDMSEINIDEPQVFSFRKATKGGIRWIYFGLY